MFDAQADPTDASQSDWLTQSLIGCVVFGIGLMQAFAGWSLRSLNDFGRPVAVLLACVGLLAIPIGTLISIYILYLLTSRKGDIVFSSEYKSTIAATQHVKYGNPILNWFLIFLMGATLRLIALAWFFRF